MGILKNDYILSILNKIVFALSNFVAIAILNRFLGPDLKGEYAVLANFITILSIIGNLGVYQSYPSNFKIGLTHIKEKYLSVFIVQFLIYTLLSILFGLYTFNFKYLMTAFSIPFTVLSNQLSMLVMVENIRYRQIVQITTMITKCIIIIGITYFFSPSVEISIFALLLVNLIQCIMFFINTGVNCSFEILNYYFIKDIIGFGSYALISDILLMFNYRVMFFILELYTSFKDIGYYSVALALSECLWLIPDAFKEVLFSRSARKNPITEINMAIKVNFWFILLCIVFIYIFGREIIWIYGGKDFMPSTVLTNILVLGIPFMALFKITNPIYLANNRQKEYCFILFITVLINIIVGIIVVPLYGVQGAAWTTVVSFVICGLLFYFRYINAYKVSWYEPFFINLEDCSNIWLKIKKH